MHEPSKFLSILFNYVDEYLPVLVGASKNTIKSYKYAFRLLIEYIYQSKGVPADQITFEMLNYDTLNGFFAWIENDRGCSAATKNQRLAALLAFSEYAQNRDFSAAAIFRNNILKIPAKKAIMKQRAVFTTEEIKILLNLPSEKNATGLRDKVLLSTMYATGARAQEMCDLTVKDIRFHEDKAIITITGKGRKKRRVGISKTSAGILKKYIQKRNIENEPDKHVFSSQTHEHMTVSCVEAIYKKYVAIAKQENPEKFREDSYPPHSMRHSTACHMLEAGVPLVVIKNFLGHASLQSTMIYAEISKKYCR